MVSRYDLNIGPDLQGAQKAFLLHQALTVVGVHEALTAYKQISSTPFRG